jgi:signal transduction histidine kinase
MFPAAVLLSLAILVSGLWMVLRDVRREVATNQLRADFVGAVSHELKTPLAVIRLYADTLMDPRGVEEPRRAAFLRGIADQCAKLTRMVENVLDFSRIDRGRKEYRMEPAALGEVVEEILGAYRPVWHGQGFDVDVRIEPDLPLVWIDREAVARAALNVLDNAVKYSEDSRYLGISLSREDGVVVLAIEDRGIGIAPQDRKKIFENFYRARNDSGKGGYGLGLYLVRHVMEAHGGRVELESEVGKGSRFRLVFPICERS